MDPRLNRRRAALAATVMTAACGLLAGPTDAWGLLGWPAETAHAASGAVLELAEGSALQTDTTDGYGDAGTYELLEKARSFRTLTLEGLESYDATLWERVYAGIDAARFRRERALFEQERAARIRWTRAGERTVVWEGARREVPIAGMEWGRDRAEELRRSLATPSLPAPLQHDPGDDRIALGTGWALHPLSDSAAHHYRFAAGDTLTIGLPGEVDDLRLVEVRVIPRREEFRLITGSLWFDDASGALVRASYRPARPFDLRMDAPEDAGDVPALLRPVRAEIRYVTMDYSFHEGRWWLPRRFAFEGEVRLGAIVRIPALFEWTLRGYEVNGPGGRWSPDALPEGWTLSSEDRERAASGDSVRITVVVPPAEDLVGSDAVGRDAVGRAPLTITDDEVEALVAALGRIPVPLANFRPRLLWGLEDGLTRFNRVEGLSTGLRASMPLGGGREVRVEPRISTGNPFIAGEVGLARLASRGRWELQGYHRTAHTSDWHTPWSVSASLSALLFGVDPAEYYRTTGLSLGHAREGRAGQVAFELFRERHRTLEAHTDFHLLSPLTDRPLRENLAAQPDTWTGLRGSVRWQSGTDPGRPLVTSRLAAEGAVEGPSFLRSNLALGLTLPLTASTHGAVELLAGSTWGRPPPQRLFFAGGPETVRGFSTGSLRGESLWAARAELGTGQAGARLIGFTDWGRIGPRHAFFRAPTRASVGAGLSLLNGLFRLEVAVPVRGGRGYRIHTYLDGLF